MTDRELFIKALNALEWNLPVIQDYGDKEQLNIQHNAITAIRGRLAQPEQEYGAVAEQRLSSLKRDMRQTLEDATVRAVHKMADEPQPEPEPVAWEQFHEPMAGPFYKSPRKLTDVEIHQQNIDALRNKVEQLKPKRPWVGLTDEEVKSLSSWWPSYNQMPALMILAKYIENSLKEKNK